jgi:uncharacterized membrane protein YeaQ/YmgE (transglycosylase-associated protein family)
MNLSHFTIQLLIAIVCGLLGNVLIPRQIPGKTLGLILVGFVGVWVGELSYQLMRNQFGFSHEILRWNIQGVQLIPSIVGSAIVIYLVTTFLRWGRYSR